jgi:hypothetical protein
MANWGSGAYAAEPDIWMANQTFSIRADAFLLYYTEYAVIPIGGDLQLFNYPPSLSYSTVRGV